jgi:RHS repeat-associated protein
MATNVIRGLLRLAAAWLGLCGMLAASQALAQPSQPIFGPFAVTLPNTSVFSTANSFDVPASATGPYLLRVKLSAPNSLTTLSFKLNNVQVLTLADFSGGKTQVDKTVVAQLHNTFSLQVAGKKGTVITVTVFATPNLPRPTSLAPDPLAITAGASGNLTATLSPTPTVSGTLAVSSANSTVASVPASVAFAAGQSQVVIPVHGAAAGTTAITASVNGGSASATVNVTPAPPTVSSLTPGTLSVTQGGSGTLSVTISSAQTASTVVSLASSNSGVASVPSTATVPAGQVSAPIAIGALSPGNSDITASLNGTSAVSHVTVTPAPPTVVSLVPAVATVTLGASTTLTLTISSAQSSDTAVALAVSPPGVVTAPAQVIVPAGQTSIGVGVGTLAFGQAGITASLNGSSASSAVNVVPQPVAVVSIVPVTLSLNVGATSQFTVSINATQPSNTEIALSVDQPSFLQLPPTVTVAQGLTSATFTATGLAQGNAVITASANNTSKTAAVHVSPQPAAMATLLPSPLPLQQGATGTLTATINVAQEADLTIGLANTAPAVASVPASVTILAGAVSVTIPVTALSPGSTSVTASINGTSATSTVNVTPPPPVVTALTPATLSLPKGTPGTLRVDVSRAPNAATSVALSSTNPSIASVPLEVNIPAGALFAEFPVVANAEGHVTITATLNGGSATASVTIAPAELVTLTLSPQTPTNYVSETVPFTATGTMTDGTTQDFTTRVTWTSSAAAVATVASTGVATPLAAGSTTVKASFTFTAVQTGQPVTITEETVLTVKLPVPLALTAPTTTPIEGQDTTVTVSSADPAPFGGLLVTLSGSGAGLGTFPPAVVILEDATSASFTFSSVTAGSYTLSATAQNRLPGTLAFNIQPLLRINAVTPASGDVGATVTLAGTGFDPIAASNLISFRGINNTTVPSAALSATPTQITVRVPPLADSGPITLSNGRGTTQSPPFTVSREQNYDLVVSPAALTVFSGASGAAQAQLASTGTKQYTGLVTLSVQGLPNGVTASFAPAATLSAFQAGTITLAASAAAAPGSYSLIVRADGKEGGATFSRTSTVTLNVQSGAGVTGIKGRFVTPDGVGISGVIVRADIAQNPQPQTTTDPAGNFQLARLPAGPVTFRFDATPANPLYPIWPYTTTVVASQVTVIPDWTINPPPSADKFVQIANATQTQAITDARFPGLEIRLPAGVTITGWDGVVKTRIAVERIMPDKLPVTAPPVPIREAYQLYFGTPMGGIPSQPIPVTLPNVSEKEPGEQVEIWYFDGSPMGGSGEWKIAGLGTVSPDGKTVASNPGVGIPRFCGVCGLLSLSCPPPPNPPQSPPDDCPTCGKPVDLFTGQELMSMDLMNLAGLTPIELSMKYNPVDPYNNRAGTVASFGFGWISSYDIGFLPFAGPQKRLVMPGAKFTNFVDDGSGSYRPFDDPRFDGAVITATDLAANEWQLKFKSGMIWRFKPFAGIPGVIRGGPPTFLTEMVNPVGTVLSIARQSNGRITAVGTPERSLRMTYGANGFVAQVSDTANRAVALTYTASNRIETVTDPDGKVTRYAYVDDSEVSVDAACSPQETMGERIKTIQFPGRLRATENFYGAGRRVLRQIGHDGRETRIAYKLTGACVTHVSNPGVRCTSNCPDVESWDNFQAGWRVHGGRVVGTTVTDPSGGITSNAFTGRGMAPTSINAEGQIARTKFDSANRIVQVTDAIGRTRKFEYDAQGNVTRSVDFLGRNTDYGYDSRWGRKTAVTRYLPDNTPVTRSYTYDATGRLASTTDPEGNVTTFGYTARGQLASITAPGNLVTTLSYNSAGDRIRQADPLGNETAIQTDGGGRPVAVTDPLGFDTRYEFNGVGLATKITDALQGETRYVFDDAHRITSVIDPRNNAIQSYQYDSHDRLAALVDGFGKAATYEYDSAGRFSRFTDRKGQATSFTFDARNRVTQANYAGVVRTLAYDAVGRVAEVREPGSVITYAYDAADRVVGTRTETSVGRSDVAYEYDTLDRVTRRTLNGGDATDYTFDKNGRIRTVSFRGETTTYAWDALGRMTRKTLPGGIRQDLQYDDASRVTQIQYVQPDDTAIETIAYGYDAKGQRISKSTSAPSIQETPIVAVYDAGNRLTNLALSGRNYALAYDNNGNLRTRTDLGNPGDVTVYEWDSRNRLTGISGPGLNAAFAYDTANRRISRTVNGATTGYLYDGSQAIAEITGGGATAALTTSVGIDEMIARHTDAGSRVYLTDALGSVIAQAKSDHSIQNFYSYTPYGEVSVLGADEGNSVQYTARENDETGLYYYRARYYDPVLKRFITEDPIGLKDGLNLYAYVRGMPTLATDPSGLTCNYEGEFPVTKGLDMRDERIDTTYFGLPKFEYDYTHLHCHFLPELHGLGRALEGIPSCLPEIHVVWWDLTEKSYRQYTTPFEIVDVVYTCVNGCDVWTDSRQQKRSTGPETMTYEETEWVWRRRE